MICSEVQSDRERFRDVDVFRSSECPRLVPASDTLDFLAAAVHHCSGGGAAKLPPDL